MSQNNCIEQKEPIYERNQHLDLNKIKKKRSNQQLYTYRCLQGSYMVDRNVKSEIGRWFQGRRGRTIRGVYITGVVGILLNKNCVSHKVICMCLHTHYIPMYLHYMDKCIYTQCIRIYSHIYIYRYKNTYIMHTQEHLYKYIPM